SRSDDESKAMDKEQRKIEESFNKVIAEQYRLMMSDLGGVLDKKELKAKAQDKDDKALTEEATKFKLDQLDIRSPERKKESQQLYHRHSERINFLLEDKERR